MTDSPTARYIVIAHEGVWKINLNNTYFGPFATRTEAVKMAIDTAYQAGKAGHAAQVLVMADATSAAFETIWTYGKDAYPPLVAG